jgi:hypothetical protein
MTSYMTQRNKILDDPSASTWLKTQVCTLEVRDPVDAFNDTEILRKLAFLRMETAFRSMGVDHINGDPRNNSPENLRLVPIREHR